MLCMYKALSSMPSTLPGGVASTAKKNFFLKFFSNTILDFYFIACILERKILIFNFKKRQTVILSCCEL